MMTTTATVGRVTLLRRGGSELNASINRIHDDYVGREWTVAPISLEWRPKDRQHTTHSVDAEESSLPRIRVSADPCVRIHSQILTQWRGASR